MVQYIHTPWRDQEELLRVRQQFYPSLSPTSLPASTSTNSHTDADAKSSDSATVSHENDDADGTHAAFAPTLDAERRRQQAVSRVSMWMQRGGCPHLVESTALLTAAVLSDLHESRTRANSSSYAIRAAYSAAFSRFVTGLLDGQQDKLRKMSMYSIAKTIGLPATFVELRHQATHEQLPSLSKLRSAAGNALAWIWDFYWRDLAPANQRSLDDNNEQSGQQRNVVVQYLREQDEKRKLYLQDQLKAWGEASLLQTLAYITKASDEPQVILRGLQLSRTILCGGFNAPSMVTSTVSQVPITRDLEAIRVELQTLNQELEDARVNRVGRSTQSSNNPPGQSVGWVRYQGTWTPKPIGIV